MSVGFAGEFADLVGPAFDLLLALNQEFAELLATAGHFAETAIEDFDFLATLREFEPGLREGVALDVAIRAQLDDAPLILRDLFALGDAVGFGGGESDLSFVPASVSFVARLFEPGELVFHATQFRDDFFRVALGVALFGLHGGDRLRDREDFRAALLE